MTKFPPSDTGGKDARGKALAVADAIDDLVSRLGVCKSLTEYGVPEKEVRGIAEKGVGSMKEFMKEGLPDVDEVHKALLAKL